MDLEIVYNCINHSLKPSQLINSQSSILNDSFSNCSDKTNVLGNTSPKSTASASSVIFNIDDNEHENGIDELSSQKDLACNSFSAKNDGSSSPVMFDVNDSENETDDHASQKSFVCNVSQKTYVSSSPLIFDVNDSENDADRLSDHETGKCLKDYPHKSPSLTSNIGRDPLDLNTAESNSSNDSVKFLQSSFVVHNTYNTPEKIQKSIQISPKNSIEKISFSPTTLKSSENLPGLCQDKYEENEMHCENYQEPHIMKNIKLKPLSVSSSQVSNDKNCDLTSLKPLKNAHVELESPVTSYSHIILSDFLSKSDNETSGVTEINTLESFDHVSSVNVSPEIKFSGAMSLSVVKNININSVSGEDDDVTSKLSFKSSPYLRECYSATKSGVDIMKKSPKRTSASPEVLICDSNSDSESQKDAHQTSSLSDYCMNFSQKATKSDTCSPANSSLSSNKSSVGDKVFESFQYFAHEISTYGKDDHPILNNNLECVEENSFSSRINVSSFECPKEEQKTAKEQKKHTAPTTDCSQPSKIPVHAGKEKTYKTG